MASTNIFKSLIFLLIITVVTASDPDILTAFVVPANSSNDAIDGNFFTFTGMRRIIEGDDPPIFKVSKASMAEFPEWPERVNCRPSIHCRSNQPSSYSPTFSRTPFCCQWNPRGWIHRHNKQTLQIGDVFVFPKGLVHYQYNSKANQPAAAISAFASASAGTVSVPTIVFASGIDENILAKDFKTDVAAIQKIKAGLAAKA